MHHPVTNVNSRLILCTLIVRMVMICTDQFES